MSEISQKVRGNASISYFMVGISLFFLLSKDPNISHNFVRAHVKNAFILHILLFLILIFFSYPLLGGYKIGGYSLEFIIQSTLLLIVFAFLLRNMYLASQGKKVGFGEILGKNQHKLYSQHASDNIEESELNNIIFSYIPFLAYIHYGEHKSNIHIYNITKINFYSTVCITLLYIFGLTSLASFSLLAYTVFAVYESILMLTQKRAKSFSLPHLPSTQEKYVLQIATLRYFVRTLKKQAFIPLSDMRKQVQNNYASSMKNDSVGLIKKSDVKLPHFLIYIPILNSITLLFLGSRLRNHIIHGAILTGLFIICLIIFGWNSPVLLLFLFPITFGMGYLFDTGYRMPYIYDVYKVFTIPQRKKTQKKAETTTVPDKTQ